MSKNFQNLNCDYDPWRLISFGRKIDFLKYTLFAPCWVDVTQFYTQAKIKPDVVHGQAVRKQVTLQYLKI